VQLKKNHLIGFSILLLLISLFSSINSIGLRGEESRRAVTGIEVYESGNVIVPLIHGKPYYNKPPLYSCILAATYYITGSFEVWAVRIPGLLAFLLTGLLSFFIVRRYTNSDTAFLAAMAYFTCADLLFYASINAGEIDLFYTLIAFSQIISIFHLYQKKEYAIMFLLSYLLAAIGTITKGIPSIAIQIITITSYLFYFKDWKTYFSWKHTFGILLFISIVGGYFYLYSRQANVVGFLENLYKESSKRTISDSPYLSSLSTLFTFPSQLMVILLPWSLFILYFFRKNIRAIIRSNPYLLFSVIYILSNIIFYWLSPRFKNRYAYIFLPNITFVLSFFYFKFKNSDIKRTQLIENIWLTLIIIFSILCLAIPFINTLAQHINNVWFYASLFTLLFALLSILYIKQKNYKLHIFVIALLTMRISFNIFLIPYFNKEDEGLVYKNHVNNMLQIAKGETICYTGDSLKLIPNVSFFNIKLANTIIYTPPLIPYQIPYYLSLQTKTILSYSPVTEKGKLYLVHMKNLKDYHIDILYSFNDNWEYKKRMILYRKK